jgi:ATP-dependent Lon protease
LLDNLKDKTVPAEVMKVIDEEIQKFMQMEKHHSEWQVTKTYLEYLTKMPYGIHSEENFDISMAKDILDKGHYGMDDVK